ncbi:MAG TPA: exodeoxyribonuclease VII small subunit [Candidatus Saccharimonadales bacterium]|nr:exodeoxyribonuclease VII small subunit [Candidatus Saccharimonadales bacterium]
MSTKNGKKRPDYEELRRELDSILDDLQSGSLDIDQALEKYKRGLELVGQLEKYLDKADNTVRELKARFDKQGG